MFLADVVGDKSNPNLSQFEKLTHHPAVAPHIEGSKKFITQWLNEMDQSLCENIEIKTYSLFPSCMYLMVDMNDDSGFSIVEPILPFFDTVERPAFKVHHSDNKVLAEKLYSSFNKIWNEEDTKTISI